MVRGHAIKESDKGDLVRVLIVEPSAIAMDRAHGAKSLLGHTRILRASGHDVEWVTNTRSTLKQDGVPNHRVLTYTIYDDVRKDRGRVKRLLRGFHYRVLVRQTARRLREIFNHRHTGTIDHLFVPTTDWILLRAIARLCRDRRKGERVPVLHLLIMYEKAGWITGGYPYGEILRLLKRLGSEIVVYTESSRHANSLAAELEREVFSYPFPAFADPVNVPGPRTSFRVCFVGGGRRDKGFGMIPDIIRAYQGKALPYDVRFIVQAPRPEDGLAGELAELGQLPDIEVLENQLGESEYQQLFNTCSVMVFPYDHHVYRSRGSGIVNEAVAHGIPYVCTEGTSLDEMLMDGNGRMARGAPAFADAVADIFQQYDCYSGNAAEMATVYRRNLLYNALTRNIERWTGTGT